MDRHRDNRDGIRALPTDLRVAPRLLDDAARRENYDAESMLQPGGTEAIAEFWNWINDSPGSQKPTACFRRSIWIGMTNLLARRRLTAHSRLLL